MQTTPHPWRYGSNREALPILHRNRDRRPVWSGQLFQRGSESLCQRVDESQEQVRVSRALRLQRASAPHVQKVRMRDPHLSCRRALSRDNRAPQESSSKREQSQGRGMNRVLPEVGSRPRRTLRREDVLLSCILLRFTFPLLTLVRTCL